MLAAVQVLVGEGHAVLVHDLGRAVGAAGDPEGLARLLVPKEPALGDGPPLYHGGRPAIGQLGLLTAHPREQRAGADGEAQPLQVGDGLDDDGAGAGHRHLHLPLPLGDQVGRPQHQNPLEARHVRGGGGDESFARAHLADDGDAPVGFEGEDRCLRPRRALGRSTAELNAWGVPWPGATAAFTQVHDANWPAPPMPRPAPPIALDQAQVLDGAPAQVVVVICPASTDPLISCCMV